MQRLLYCPDFPVVRASLKEGLHDRARRQITLEAGSDGA
jgi:hypothetical protein